MLETYAELPIAGFVFGPPTFERHGRDATLAHLDRIQPWVERYATAPSP
ncbi:MAG: hypothetical protein KatS3mg124_0213 [Porticoccaceae bacterium]|nr:MAG: hypothetical protein KatS3mg124_0213 [Porticoccaceae bacterium]